MQINPRFEIFTGPMFGGKTTRLLSSLERYKYQNKNILLFKPSIDERYSRDSIVTHSGIKWNNNNDSFGKIERVSNGALLYKIFKNYDEQNGIDVVAIDEAFMIDGVSEAAIEIYKLGKTVLISSLQLSSAGKPYEEMINLLPWATSVQICPAVCSVCGEDAYFTIKNGGKDENEIEVGGSELYQPVCFKHFF